MHRNASATFPFTNNFDVLYTVELSEAFLLCFVCLFLLLLFLLSQMDEHYIIIATVLPKLDPGRVTADVEMKVRSAEKLTITGTFL